jgi:hypothetical protein
LKNNLRKVLLARYQLVIGGGVHALQMKSLSKKKEGKAIGCKGAVAICSRFVQVYPKVPQVDMWG